MRESYNSLFNVFTVVHSCVVADFDRWVGDEVDTDAFPLDAEDARSNAACTLRVARVVSSLPDLVELVLEQMGHLNRDGHSIHRHRGHPIPVDDQRPPKGAQTARRATVEYSRSVVLF